MMICPVACPLAGQTIFNALLMLEMKAGDADVSDACIIATPMHAGFCDEARFKIAIVSQIAPVCGLEERG
jgi:hypothetical protein